MAPAGDPDTGLGPGTEQASAEEGAEKRRVGGGTAGRPVFGRPSLAAEREPLLGAAGDATCALYRAEGGSTGWGVLRAACVTGVRHRLAGEPGEDTFAWALDKERLVVAVADGVGAVPGSALTASRAALGAVQAGVAAGGDPPGAVLAAVQGANQACQNGGATTLVAAVVDSDGSVALARVGDSSAFVTGASGRWWVELFPAPEKDPGEMDPRTDALPAPQPEAQTAARRLERGEVLLLATDGVADPWRDGPRTVAPALAAALCEHPSPLELAELADFSRQGCHDDRTMLVVWLT